MALYAEAGQVTRHRRLLLALLFAISVVTYLDRVNISITARQMMPELGLTALEMGTVFSAFVLGYALCQIPGGWLGDRWGARRVLTLALLWWSIFTALTAVAPMLPFADLLGVVGSLALVRFLIGVGEAAALPNFNRAVADSLPAREQGLGIGITISGIGLGSAVTPSLTAWIMVNFGWQMPFYAAAALGLVIAGIWSVATASTPLTCAIRVPAPSPEATVETASSVIPPVPWWAFARTPSVRWLVLSYTCLGCVAYVYMSWFYLYLVNARGFDGLRGSLYAALPFVAMAVFCPLGGWLTDRLTARLGINRGRAAVGATGMVLSAVSILLGATADSPFVALGCLSLGAGWLYFTVGPFWASTIDLTRPHAGTPSGLMNTGANLGGTLAPSLTPWLAEQFSWSARSVPLPAPRSAARSCGSGSARATAWQA